MTLAEDTRAAAVKSALDHVLWLGGAPDAGKTTVARLLAERHGFHLYVLDAAMQAHWAKANPAWHPAFTAFQALTLDERWVLPTPAAMAQQIVRIGAERFGLAIENLLMLPRQPHILAERPWLFPELVAPLLFSPRQAIWLVPTTEFKLASAARRDKPRVRSQTSDPERTRRN